MRMICDCCGGTGWVKDKDGRLDVCEECWGLGYVETSQLNKESPETKEEINLRKKSTYVVIGVLGSYYALLFGISHVISLNIFIYLVLILIGYYFSSAMGRLYYNHMRGNKPKKGEKKTS
jgi:hypothetical protein